MVNESPQQDPVVAQRSLHGWVRWVWRLLVRGREWVAGAGLALVLAFFAAVASLYLFAGLAENVVERDSQALDDAVLYGLRQYQSPWLDSVMYGISFMGSEAVAILLVLLLAVFGVQRRWGAALSLMVVTVGAQLLNNVLKDLFQRTRPAPVDGFIAAQAWSFPSGHAMVSAAFYLFLAYVAWRLLRGPLRGLVTGGLITLVLLIGLSRLYLGVHYLTDVAAGYVAGAFWTDAVVLGGRFLGRASRRPLPAGASDALPGEEPAPSHPVPHPEPPERRAA